MPDRRIVKASARATPLLLDIVESTAHLTESTLHTRRVEDAIEAASATDLSLGHCSYFIGFEDHLPFGFIGLGAREECGEVVGPYLYRDYLRKGYGSFLVNHLLEIAEDIDLHIFFVLASQNDPSIVPFFTHNGFEVISDDPEVISRWRDGLLADHELVRGSILLARLVDRMSRENDSR